eukprot:8896028-Pyramimonas_sp.AAC.1
MRLFVRHLTEAQKVMAKDDLPNQLDKVKGHVAGMTALMEEEKEILASLKTESQEMHRQTKQVIEIFQSKGHGCQLIKSLEDEAKAYQRDFSDHMFTGIRREIAGMNNTMNLDISSFKLQLTDIQQTMVAFSEKHHKELVQS